MTPEQITEARDLVARLAVLLAEPVTEPDTSPPPVNIPPENEPIQKIGLTENDYAQAAGMIVCDVATIRAVDDVESNGRGFGDDERPIILYEPHVFSRLTNHRFDSSYGGISYPKWGTKPYPKTQKERWDQVLFAAKLDRDAAYQAASYGRFQIMGFNYASCAFSTVHDFVAAMGESERNQLFAFVQYVVSNHLDDELRERRWADFALRYNGPGYKKNAYDTKLAAAYARHA